MSDGTLLGIDIGSSSVKVSLINLASGACTASAYSPQTELPISAPQPGYAEQEPELWWEHLVKCASALRTGSPEGYSTVRAIGITYQMHGLVLLDKNGNVLRPSIIWCDSRAVPFGERAFRELGTDFCLSHYLNSPGNFTAAKLRWVFEKEPDVYRKIHAILLPGDYIAYRLTGEITTTTTGLSEAILWDFPGRRIASEVLNYFEFDPSIIPPIVPIFGEQGKITAVAAEALGLPSGIPVTYRAGDQPNNAFSLNVLEPGEIAATAGTSGVVYGVAEKPVYDERSRVNTFVHVNDTSEKPRNGVLLCMNGTGALNRWLRSIAGYGSSALSYQTMNDEAAKISAGSEGIKIYPYGNGAERTLENNDPGCTVSGINFNRHTPAHLFRAAQEGIIFALYYGISIMKGMGLNIFTVKAGHANMFLSPLFAQVFADVTQASVELYNTDGAQGAARGAGVGAGFYSTPREAFEKLSVIKTFEPSKEGVAEYAPLYSEWVKFMPSQK